MRGTITGNLIGNDHLLYSKEGFAIYEIRNNFFLNKKRLSAIDMDCQDTQLSIQYKNEPYRCIVLTLKTDSRFVSQVGFKTRTLGEVIRQLEGDA
jgi:hypothetical protein